MPDSPVGQGSRIFLTITFDFILIAFFCVLVPLWHLKYLRALLSYSSTLTISCTTFSKYNNLS